MVFYFSGFCHNFVHSNDCSFNMCLVNSPKTSLTQFDHLNFFSTCFPLSFQFKEMKSQLSTAERSLTESRVKVKQLEEEVKLLDFQLS